MPGGKPVTAVPGLTPRSPVMTEGPVLVTVAGKDCEWRRRFRVGHVCGDCQHGEAAAGEQESRQADDGAGTA